MGCNHQPLSACSTCDTLRASLAAAQAERDEARRWAAAWRECACRYNSSRSGISETVVMKIMHQLKQAREKLAVAREALEGVLRVADRKTREFDAAREALSKLDSDAKPRTLFEMDW